MVVNYNYSYNYTSYKFIKVGFELIVTLHNYCCMYNCTDLQKQITQSSTPTPTVEVLNTVSDVRSWLEPCIDGLNGHSLPHCFKFFLEDGKAVMYFRHWSSDAWCNADVAVKLLLASPHVITFFLSVIIINTVQAHAYYIMYGNTLCVRVYAVVIIINSSFLQTLKFEP